MLQLLCLLLVISLNAMPCSAGTTTASKESISWQNWSDAAFQKAKKENKPVILDLEAVWCHWCHVMDQKTYTDPSIAKLINEHFVALRVDQDSRPDLSNRYQDYGWPATIFFAPSGSEIVKRAGYISPEDMNSLLVSIIKNPNKPEQSVSAKHIFNASSKAVLSDSLQSKLQKQCLDGYDPINSGWGTGHKFMDWDTLEYCLVRAKAKDTKCAQMAKDTLKAAINLIDPIWGGVYQYSTDGDWHHQHFEKIMQMQAEGMRIYALAYQLWHDPVYLKAATDIQRFLHQFLTSPDNAFYTSMDADIIPGKSSAEYFKLSDANRQKIGIPKIDKHLYARENGWAITGLVALYGATGDQSYLDEAIRAANWAIANRALPDGGFRHDAADKAGPYLDDTLSMGRAFLALYASTADRHWLVRAEQTASFIDKHFQIATKNGAGYSTAMVHPPLTPDALVDENVMLARWSNLLYHYTGNTNYQKMSQHAMRYLAIPEIAKNCGFYTAGILLANSELTTTPLHITVVGRKNDPEARALFLSALKYPSAYKRVDWFDHSEGPLPNTDTEYPELKRAAAFVCINQRCSMPAYTPEKVTAIIEQNK